MINAISDKQALVTEMVEPKANQDLTGVHILLVEDNLINQRLNEQLFRKWKATFHCASNGRQALELLRQHTYDIVLMDLQMPELDGYETTRLIRNLETPVLQHDIPIIALTANAFAHTRHKALEIGMNDFISKPFKQAHLLQAILRNLGQGIPLGKESASPVDLPPDGPMNQEMHVDLSLIKEIVEDDEQAMIAVLNDFITGAKQDIALLHQNYQNQQWQSVADVAHKLKSTFRYLGVKEIEIQVVELEDTARVAGNAAAIALLIAAITQCYEITQKEVRAILEKMNSEMASDTITP